MARELTHAGTYLRELVEISETVNLAIIESMVAELAALRARKGTLYLVGIGGSAANCTHAAADFRKLCGLKTVSLADSIAEVSARANDEGWDTVFTGQMWDAGSLDALFVLSVGGGTDKVSRPITAAVREAKNRCMSILGVVGPQGNATAGSGGIVLKVPAQYPRITPHTEAFQMVVVHLLVSHPALQRKQTVW